MATEFDDSDHWGLFLTNNNKADSTTLKFVRMSALTLAALRAAGLLDNMIDGTVPPATDKLWLDKNFDPPQLKEYEPISSTWQRMTFERLFNRATVITMTVTGGTENALIVSAPTPFMTGKLYAITASSTNAGATTIQVSGVSTYDAVYPGGAALSAGELYQSKVSIFLFQNGRFELVFGYGGQYAAEQAAATAIAIATKTVRVDVAQSFTTDEKAQARSNIGLGTAAVLAASAIALLGVSPHFTVNVGIGVAARFALDVVQDITAPTADGAIHHVANKPDLLATSIYAPQVPAGYYYNDGIRSVMEVSDDSTVTHTSAFGAYYINKSVQGGTGGTEANAVGYFSLGIAAVNNSATWGLNTALNDNTVNGLATLTGRKLIGWEGDFQVNGASTIQGCALIIQGDGTPAGANAFTVNHQVSTTAKWQRAFVTGDGSCTVAAMVVGANQVSGSNIGSQPILFSYFNGSGVAYQQKMQAVNGGFNFTSSAFTDGIYLAANNSNPIIGVTGSSTNANLNLRAAGTGYVSISTSGTYFASTGELYIGSAKVLGARDTGWTAMTGTGDKATSYAVSTVTLAQLAGRVAQLQAALTSQGIIGPSS
ncbi:hypothetical protein GOZ83_19765 [Agrobacterium vitis]|uniref:hypothetical protein n=1 Tax=Agrobacterium vitis TaxID=373 RepID=UPI0012E75EF7|nr:hypothetical protein [Agrobacterium vitis]MVA47296.1 hypothetical protein [Agrobacterium vitis]